MNQAKSIERKQDQAQEHIRRPEETSAHLPSSHGDAPKEIAPKEVAPGDAAWAYVTVRETCSEDAEIRHEALLDEAVDQTFPASDPVAELPSHSGSQLHLVWEDEEEELLDEAIEMTFPASDPIAIAEPSREDWTAKSAHPKH